MMYELIELRLLLLLLFKARITRLMMVISRNVCNIFSLKIEKILSSSSSSSLPPPLPPPPLLLLFTFIFFFCCTSICTLTLHSLIGVIVWVASSWHHDSSLVFSSLGGEVVLFALFNYDSELEHFQWLFSLPVPWVFVVQWWSRIVALFDFG